MEAEETQNKGIRFPTSLVATIEKVAEKERRDFSKQVIYFCERGVAQYWAGREGQEIIADEQYDKVKKEMEG